jgi:Family of unknown function (DUF5681)
MSDDAKSKSRTPRGQWVKGVSGNPKGRPRRSSSRPSQADLYLFGQDELELQTNGRRVRMTRREILLSKIYERAIKGDVRAQIHLDKRFRELDLMQAEARQRLTQLEREYIIEGHAGSMPREIEYEILTLRSLLDPAAFLAQFAKNRR